jgi:hypothetical protein
MFGIAAWAADEHHPADATGGPSGMMGGGGPMMGRGEPRGMMMGAAGSGGMMQMMGAGMMGERGMPMMGMMTDHIEGRLAFLKTELKITDAQMPTWEAFADVVRANATAMRGMHETMMESRQEPLPARIEQHEKLLSAHLEVLRKIKTALEPLYASFNDEQKRNADQLMMSPMGMM